MKRWDIDDEIYLEMYYNDKDNKSVDDALEILPGNNKSVVLKASKLRKEGCNIRYMRKRWTDEENDYIIKHYQNTPYHILARKFGVDEKTVRDRIRVLKLPRKITDVKLYDSEIRELAKQGLSRKEIANGLGLKESQIQYYVIKHKIETKKMAFKLTEDNLFRKQNRRFWEEQIKK